MLRGIVGDSTFFKIMKTYTSDPRYAYKSAATADFRSIAESVSGQDLKYFFDEWIYGVNFPYYMYNWNYTNTGGNIYQVNVSIKQQARSNPQYFTMPVQIKITTTAGDTTVTVFNDKLQQEFNITVKGIPSQLTFDPNNFKRINYYRSTRKKFSARISA